MKHTSIILMFLGASLTMGFAPDSFAQESGAPVPTITRLVKNFSALESEWMGAVTNRDGAALDRILADDFEMRTGNEPGRPIPRADWIKQSFQEKPVSSSTEQMAVHDFGNLALVSFLWNIESPTSGGSPRRLFVVDTWELQGGAWHAKIRYVAPAGQADMPIPGNSKDSVVLDKRY